MKKEIKIKIKKLADFFSKTFFVFLLVMPSSTNYQLKDFGFGTGGTTTATDGTYSIEAITGEVSADQLSGASYNLGPGLVWTNQANVPPAPTFTNPSNYYNKLHFIVAVGGNPSDTKFVIAISTDNFTTTNYVQSDNTVGAALGSEDYQTYANWGGASGEYVIGLAAGTEYKIKVKAMQGNFTETGYGPVATVSTSNPTISFNISTNSINFSDLTAGTVVDSPQNIVINFATNGESGGRVYVYGQNGGLSSSHAGNQINSATADLTAAQQGFGARSVSATQTSGGPLAAVAPYDGAANNVGIVDTNIREIFSTANPIVGGVGTFMLKAKASAITPSASDYSETLTVIAAGSF